MQKAKLKYLLYLTVCLFFLTGVPAAQATSEEDLFNTQNDPDALIVLDLSGSMLWNPTGGAERTNRYGLSECSGDKFLSAPDGDYQTDCRRVAIAKRVIAKILDENNSGAITSADRTSMGVRFGYMRFYNCSSNSAESSITGYGSTSACTPDTNNCTGASCGRTDGYCNNSVASFTHYASNGACVADTTNCRGTGCSDGFCSSETDPHDYYSADSTCTANTFNCSGTGCSDGFCESEKSNTVYGSTLACTADATNCAGSNCESGFCKSSKLGKTYYAASDCSVRDYNNCTGNNCSDGFCSKEKKKCKKTCSTLGCKINCSANFTCKNKCTTADCKTSCTTTGCTNQCVMTSTMDWTSGCNTLVSPISTLTGGVDVDTPYSCIYCRNSSTCSTTASTCGTDTACTNTGGNCVAGETADGGTHLAASLAEAKAYLDAHKNNDPNKYCRNKFVVLISDGADTYACNGDGSETQSDMYKRRRETLAMAKALADAKYKVFVIGFGKSLAPESVNTLEWMAYYGGTDNPTASNYGDTSAYPIPTGSLYYNDGTHSVTSCQANSSYDPGSGTVSVAEDGTVTTTGNYPLSGYAFFASDTKQLSSALKAAINIIRESTYSFTQASVQSSRTADENYIYEASFEPVQDEPFWHGHLKKFAITSEGKVGDMVTNGDAGDNLRTKTAASRTIWTAVNGSTFTNFTTSLAPEYFGLLSTETTQRTKIVNYIRGLCEASPGTCYNPDKDASGNVYKLGDIFRSTPITIASPNPYFNDTRDYYERESSVCQMDKDHIKAKPAFATFRDNHCRASSCTSTYNGISDTQRRLIVAGANDGQLHAFKTADMTEAWSFIPPNHLAKLGTIAHDTHPTTLGHQYFVDGPVTVADVWLGPGALAYCKESTEWKTLLVFGEGRGTSPYNWSESPYCDNEFNLDAKFDATHNPFYCGYHALDVTDTLSPAYKWNIKGSGAGGAMTSAHGPYWGDAWSRMIPGRIRYKSGTEEVEKWVGFVGGGYNKSICTGTTCGTNCDCRGKGFFVIDLSDGTILWSFTNGAASNTASPNMKYSLPADPAIVDADGDGFIDTAYMGDLGGNMWRFEFCKNKNMPGCVSTAWKGTKLFDGTNMTTIRPVYTAPAVTVDSAKNIWVIWGTGDKDDPIKIPTYKEYIFAVKDKIPANQPYDIADLSEVTTTETAFSSTNETTNIGYYRKLAGSGEKMLAEPLAFGGYVYFTTYTPPATTSTDCSQDGTAQLYQMSYLTGLATSEEIGTGIPSAPVVSMRPGTGSKADMFITVSGVFKKLDPDKDPDQHTGNPSVTVPTLINRTNVLFWRDQRLQ